MEKKIKKINRLRAEATLGEAQSCRLLPAPRSGGDRDIPRAPERVPATLALTGAAGGCTEVRAGIWLLSVVHGSRVKGLGPQQAAATRSLVWALGASCRSLEVFSSGSCDAAASLLPPVPAELGSCGSRRGEGS